METVNHRPTTAPPPLVLPSEGGRVSVAVAEKTAENGISCAGGGEETSFVGGGEDWPMPGAAGAGAGALGGSWATAVGGPPGGISVGAALGAGLGAGLGEGLGEITEGDEEGEEEFGVAPSLPKTEQVKYASEGARAAAMIARTAAAAGGCGSGGGGGGGGGGTSPGQLWPGLLEAEEGEENLISPVRGGAKVPPIRTGRFSAQAGGRRVHHGALEGWRETCQGSVTGRRRRNWVQGE